ncbi:MAG: carboxylating nicotinate-nucleotide diphosphorylase [Candidatus Margulisiibacteriota bacterium]|nr:carboxylating nicotinate-nucleotide diphosphorylase [Candidatus Margulisiibacteriota bacterium]
MGNVKVRKIVREALREDVGAGDITTRSIVVSSVVVQAVIRAKEAGVIAGLPAAKEVFRQIDRKIKFVPKVKDGAKVKRGKIIATVSGPARGILTGERVALNFLQRLSGIATLTNQFVKKGKKAKILDTRKTTPGLRALEKYAVKMGGGVNHRFGLYDAVLIKDNHIDLAGGIDKAIVAAKLALSRKEIEVEAKTTAQVKKSMSVGADRILLDNMSLKNLRKAVKLCKKAKVKTEASGGVSLKTVSKIAATGVDAISVGALTHSARALDISLDIV